MVDPCIVKIRDFRDCVGFEGICGCGSWKSESCMKPGSEWQPLEVIGINELANAFVRLASNLIAKGRWILESVFGANEAFGEIIYFIT